MIRSFQESAVNLGPVLQLQEKLHYLLMQKVDSALLKVPFPEPYPPQGIVSYMADTLLKKLMERLSTSPHHSYQPPSALNPADVLEKNRKEWFAPLMESAQLSQVWDVVDRNSLERIIYDDSYENMRRHLNRGLYALLSIWTYFHYGDSRVKYRNI